VTEFFHPSIFFVACAAGRWLPPGRLGRWLPPVAAALAIASVLAMQPGSYTRFSYLGLTLGLGGWTPFPRFSPTCSPSRP